MQQGRIYIGTSGWNYKHWKGTFYPADVKDSEQFGLYMQTFNTVELNNSFYHLPAIKTFSGWRKAASEGFIFSIKASRYITHMKKLIVDKDSIKKFFSHAGTLKEKMGPVLFQLPPHWKINVERLATFLARLPKGKRYTFEFRNETWYQEQVYELLKKYNCAFCIYELERHLSPFKETANFIYIGLHGPGNKYQGSYSDTALQKWKTRCLKWQENSKDVYIYFDNDQEGFAAFNAQKLLEMIH
jgi:uncharacterized protein YecE (DUF72 family)